MHLSMQEYVYICMRAYNVMYVSIIYLCLEVCVYCVSVYTLTEHT